MSKKARADWWADGDDAAPPSPAGAQAALPVAVAARSVLADVRARAQSAGAREGTINDNAKRVAELTDSFETYLRMHELVSSNALPTSQTAPLIDISAPPCNGAYEPALPLSNLFPLSGSLNNSLSLSDILSGRVEAALAASIQRDQLQQQIMLQQQQQQSSQPAVPPAASISPRQPAVTPPVPSMLPSRAPPPSILPTLLSVPSTIEPRVILPSQLKMNTLSDLPSGSDVARLTITSQPGPKSLWKKRPMTPPFAVRILTVPGVALKESGPVRAYLVSDSPERIEVENASIKPDATNTATFTNLRFSKGSHQHLAHLYFECQVVATDGRIATLTSPPSEPFIVCTNISQWLSSEKKIFKRVCFGDEARVPFQPTFRLHLESHFARAVSSCRGLTSADVEYIHSVHLHAQAQVTQEEFEQFWSWYGPALKEVYEKAGHARLLWERYWLFGFVAEETAGQCLRQYEVGTFILAFSALTPVMFVRTATGVEAVDPKGPIREALIEHQELTQLLFMGADETLRVMPKLAVVKGLRRRKDSESPILL